MLKYYDEVERNSLTVALNILQLPFDEINEHLTNWERSGMAR